MCCVLSRLWGVRALTVQGVYLPCTCGLDFPLGKGGEGGSGFRVQGMWLLQTGAWGGLGRLPGRNNYFDNPYTVST